jgi:hypothetical protein
MKMYGGVEVWLYAFLISAPGGGQWSVSPPGHFNPRERAPDPFWIGGWAGSRAAMDAVEKRKEFVISEDGTCHDGLRYWRC